MTGTTLQTYFGSTEPLIDAALDPDGSTMVTAGLDGTLRFWDVKLGRMIWTLYAHKSSIGGVHFEGTRSLDGELTMEVGEIAFHARLRGQDRALHPLSLPALR
jgi:WD40 repeat protein